MEASPSGQQPRVGCDATPASSPTAGLTAREVEVLGAYARTGTQAQAAHELVIAKDTLKTHLASVYSKLQVPSAIDAFRALGWLRAPNEPEVAALVSDSVIAAARVRLQAARDEIDATLTHLVAS